MEKSEHVRQLNLGRFHRRLFLWRVMQKPWWQVLEEGWKNGSDTSDPLFCWVWTSSMMRGKYPCFTVIDPVTLKSKTVYARRYAYETVFGLTLPSDAWLTTEYTCKVERCVNPFHVFRTTSTTFHVDRERFWRDEHRNKLNAELAEEKRKHAAQLEQSEREYRRRSTDNGYIDPLQAEIEANSKKGK